jgi:putative acetyltransferase
MKIRRFKTTDTPILIELFRNTVHTVCKKDYSEEQLKAWAPPQIDPSAWTDRFAKSFTIVAITGDEVVGFSNLREDGYIDMFYVAAAFQAQGVGKKLYSALEAEAVRSGIGRLTSDVSLTARKFFHSMGFAVEREYRKQVGTVTFPNAIMAKILNGSAG